MSSTPLSSDAATETSDAPTVPMRFEVTRLPVADVDRAKAFYQRLGWRLDIEFKPDGQHRFPSCARAPARPSPPAAAGG